MNRCAVSTKFQAPNSKEIQRRKYKEPKRRHRRATFWTSVFEFRLSLEFGTWDLEFRNNNNLTIPVHKDGY
jgi:hypothetical protein